MEIYGREKLQVAEVLAERITEGWKRAWRGRTSEMRKKLRGRCQERMGESRWESWKRALKRGKELREGYVEGRNKENERFALPSPAPLHRCSLRYPLVDHDERRASGLWEYDGERRKMEREEES